MRHWTRLSVICLVLVSLLVETAAPVSVGAEAQEEYMTFSEDFDGLLQPPGPVWDIDDYFQVNNAQIMGGVLTSAVNGLYGLRYKQQTPETGVYSVAFDLKSASNDTAPWDTFYLGLRLNNMTSQANDSDGLWLALRGNQIGMRVGAWPQVSYMNMNVPLNTMRRVYIEDHVEENYWDIFAADDLGVKTLVAQVRKDGQTVSMYSADDLQTPAITNELTYTLSNAGYIHWWVHHLSGIEIDNVAVTIGESVHETTFPMDTMLHSDDWEVNNGIIVDGQLTNETGGLYGMIFKRKLADSGVHYIDFDLKSETLEAAPWNTAYVGLRLQSYNANASHPDGLWLAFRNNEIGIRTNEWPLTGYVTIPYSFDEMRRVFLEDDVDNNVVNVFVEDDQGVKTFVARVSIQDTQVMLYSADDLQTAAVVSTSGHPIEKSGFLSWWVHLIPDVAFDNFSITMKEYKRAPYIPADSLKYRDVYSDTWVATDALGRSAATYQEAGGPRDKKVGMFYFIWHDAVNGEIYDHNKAYEEGGIDAVWEMVPQGPLGYAHYWAEPYFGYYRSDDRWVIRKHASMMVESGIDFIFLDNSNNVLYPHIYPVILDEYKKMRNEGLDTPEIVFFFGDRPDFGKNMAQQVWDELFKDDYYNDLWFMVEGKPLILGNFDQVDDAIKEKFTIRKSWAFNDWTGDGIGKWPWIAEYPQLPGRHPETGEIEQLVVAAGFHANGAGGRSKTGGVQPTDGHGAFEFELESTPYGLTYNEQWERVFELDPEYIMLVGWNEWWAGRWENDAHGQLIANTYTVQADHPLYKHYYVDAFNPEFSRDIEPMKGGFQDNYYYQTVDKVREYKGVRPLPAVFGQSKINMKKDFREWNSVGPEYRDTTGDTGHRDNPSFAGVYQYVNDSGRNDIEYAKVSSHTKDWYFYVRTKEDMTAPEGTNWMNLFVDSDQDDATGWSGYDYVLNRTRSNGKLSVERSIDNGWSWETVGMVEYKQSGRELSIMVPKTLLNIDANKGFDFKWADNSTVDGDVMEFLDRGDVAPNGRFNFRYSTNKAEVELSGELKDLLKDTIALRANTYEAYLNGKRVLVDANDTNATPISHEGNLYIPSVLLNKAVKPNKKKDVSRQSVRIDGTDYVEGQAAAALLEMQLIIGKDGLVLFTTRQHVEQTLAEELLRKL